MYQHRMKASHSVIFSTKTVFMIKKKSRIRSFRSSHTTQKVSIFVVFLVRIQLNAGTYIPKNCEYRLLLCSVVTQLLMNCNPSLQKQPSIGTLQKAVLKTFVSTTENLLVQVCLYNKSYRPIVCNSTKTQNPAQAFSSKFFVAIFRNSF